MQLEPPEVEPAQNCGDDGGLLKNPTNLPTFYHPQQYSSYCGSLQIPRIYHFTRSILVLTYRICLEKVAASQKFNPVVGAAGHLLHCLHPDSPVQIYRCLVRLSHEAGQRQSATDNQSGDRIIAVDFPSRRTENISADPSHNFDEPT